MNKPIIKFLLSLVVCLSFTLSIQSCDDTKIKSFSDLKKEELTAINNFIKKNNFKVEERKTDDLPKNIDPNVYYKMSNGLYMRVIKKGEDKPVSLGTVVSLMFKGHMFSISKAKLRPFDNLSMGDTELTRFRYTYFYNQGDVHFVLIPQETAIPNYDHYMCEGLAYPISLLGAGAEVSLIIPFKLGPKGTYKQGLSSYMEEVVYLIKNDK